MCDTEEKKHRTVSLEIFVHDFKMFICPIFGATFATCEELIRLSDNNRSGSPVTSREFVLFVFFSIPGNDGMSGRDSLKL